LLFLGGGKRRHWPGLFRVLLQELEHVLDSARTREEHKERCIRIGFDDRSLRANADLSAELLERQVEEREICARHVLTRPRRRKIKKMDDGNFRLGKSLHPALRRVQGWRGRVESVEGVRLVEPLVKELAKLGWAR
jgi:hypothetical protein